MDGRFLLSLVSFLVVVNIQNFFVIVHFHSKNCHFLYISFYFSSQKYDYSLPGDVADFYSYYRSTSQLRRMWSEPTWSPGIVLALRFRGLP